MRHMLAVIRDGATEADATAAFPAAAIAAIRADGLLAAAAPAEFGGGGYDAAAAAELAMSLGSACGSTAMIWAMHQLQLACLARGAASSPVVAGFLREACERQLLIASITSEEGVSGLRQSNAAVIRKEDEALIEKRATTVSYCEQADAYLVTARSGPDAPPADQVLVLVRRDQATVVRTGGWNTLGMRGTCSPPAVISATVPAGQVLDEPFEQIAARCMVPLSHLLWAAVWSGIAADALARAADLMRARTRAMIAAGKQVPADPRLGAGYAAHRLAQDAVRQFACDYDCDRIAPAALALRANALKTATSRAAVQVAEAALDICGVAGYREDGPYSVARHLRDLYSARLMVPNHSLDVANSQLLLIAGSVIGS